MLFPVGGILLALSGLTLAGTVIGLVVTTPLFVIFSPVLVPAAIVVALAVAGFLSSGAFGLTAVTSLAWIVNYLRGGRGAEDVRDLGSSMHEQMEHVKRRMAEAAGHVGQKTKDAGQGMQSKAAQEGGAGRN
ncbi:Oleosin 18.2 kDa [Platanthera guangdongensis]|uniref:Oleosin 18.2 kDa n=1 Tax=Platanthera guangdongensis TaxID=2320717 RepID=A0ABR2M8R0_9ASPA